MWEGLLCVPLVNMAWERALAIWGQLSMSVEEQRRRLLTQTLYSSSVRASTVSKLFKREVGKHKEMGFCLSHHRVNFKIPRSICNGNIWSFGTKQTFSGVHEASKAFSIGVTSIRTSDLFFNIFVINIYQIIQSILLLSFIPSQPFYRCAAFCRV